MNREPYPIMRSQRTESNRLAVEVHKSGAHRELRCDAGTRTACRFKPPGCISLYYQSISLCVNCQIRRDPAGVSDHTPSLQVIIRDGFFASRNSLQISGIVIASGLSYHCGIVFRT